MTPANENPRFLLLLRQPAGPIPPPEELAKIMKRFADWMSDLRAKAQVLGTNGLEGGGVVLRGAGGLSATDGPYLETKEIVGGYVLLAAADWNTAVALARGCPGLDYQMTVEVRPVRPMA